MKEIAKACVDSQFPLQPTGAVRLSRAVSAAPTPPTWRRARGTFRRLADDKDVVRA